MILLLQDAIATDSPDTTIPRHAWDHSAAMSETDQLILWRTAKSIYKAARKCQERNRDESGWCQVVRLVFDGAIGEYASHASGLLEWTSVSVSHNPLVRSAISPT